MTNRGFTKSIAQILLQMVAAQDNPIIDYVKRSQFEQKRLFDAKLSKCDGTIRISAHQKGLAADIYLCTIDTLGKVVVNYEWDKNKAIYWHNVWEKEFGGKPMIDWDPGHFEG